MPNSYTPGAAAAPATPRSLPPINAPAARAPSASGSESQHGGYRHARLDPGCGEADDGSAGGPSGSGAAPSTPVPVYGAAGGRLITPREGAAADDDGQTGDEKLEGYMRKRAEGMRKSSGRAADAYRRIAQERCNVALREAEEAMQRQSTRSRPPHVWWGFHWFWPPEERTLARIANPMEDPEFVRKVFRMMNDDRTIDTFAIFDEDGSGSISVKELKGLVEMLVPNPLPTLVAEMIAELDINRDGEVDLWEFCVHMQKRAEGITLTDLEQEVDMAFKLFSADAAGHASEEELRRVMTNAGTGVGLSAGEFEDLLNDLSNRGIRRADGAIDLRALRAHPCYENESAGVEGSSNE